MYRTGAKQHFPSPQELARTPVLTRCFISYAAARLKAKIRIRPGSAPSATRCVAKAAKVERFPSTSSGQHQQRLGGRRQLPTQPCNTTAACSDVRVSK